MSEFKGSVPIMDIGYQGVPGCYSYQIGLEYFGEEIETLSCRRFRDVFEALAKGEIQYGILPIENSTSGSINDVYDLLREYEFHIVGEKCLKVEHNLLGMEGAELTDIREVYSHEQGLIQCSRYLSEHPEWKQVPYFDTAGSAEYVSKEGLKFKACIAGKMAAAVYGLAIINSNIQDSRNNSTRFVIISKDKLETEKADKISIIISVPHKPGALYRILKRFAEGNCNLMKIESRPLEDKPWEYFFYIDFGGNLKEEGTTSIMSDIERESLYFRLLGNYESEAGCRL
jgi:chorismate mutase/prephenate dehydratase